MGAQATTGRRPGIMLYRFDDASTDEGIPLMSHEAPSAMEIEGSRRVRDAGLEVAHENRVLFAAAGFSLVYAWFKSGYPLPRHTHNSNCLYYIVAGSLHMGKEELKAGDGFFVGKDVPYTYTAGDAGVEILEFRACEAFNIKLMADNPAFWDRAVETVKLKHKEWRNETKPSA